jgi:hypothetical protein
MWELILKDENIITTNQLLRVFIINNCIIDLGNTMNKHWK